MKNFLTNWKTTAAAVATMLPAFADALNYAAQGHVTPNLNTDLSAVVIGLGLLFAKDGNVTDGTKPGA